MAAPFRTLFRAAVLPLLATALNGCALRTAPDGAPESGWTAVTSLPRGASVRVELASGVVHSGATAWADRDQLVITTRGGIAALRRDDVLRVFVLGRPRGERVGHGFLIGAAAGYAGAMYFTGHMGWGLRMGATWGAIGAGIAASTHDKQGRVVYQRSTGVPHARFKI